VLKSKECIWLRNCSCCWLPLDLSKWNKLHRNFWAQI